MHFDKTNYYDRKDLKSKEFANDEWQKYDDKLFANPTNIIDANKPIFKFQIIPCKSSKTYHYSNESRSLSPLLDILDPLVDEEYEEEDNATFEDEESHLQLNRGDRDFSIQPLDAIF